jgi:hypothetical protein
LLGLGLVAAGARLRDDERHQQQGRRQEREQSVAWGWAVHGLLVGHMLRSGQMVTSSAPGCPVSRGRAVAHGEERGAERQGAQCRKHPRKTRAGYPEP